MKISILSGKSKKKVRAIKGKNKRRRKN
jgi:hypothetical protein